MSLKADTNVMLRFNYDAGDIMLRRKRLQAKVKLHTVNPKSVRDDHENLWFGVSRPIRAEASRKSNECKQLKDQNSKF